MLIIGLIVLLLGAGVAVAAFLFPSKPSVSTTNTVANSTLRNQTNRTNTPANINAVSNINQATPNLNSTNGTLPVTNTNVPETNLNTTTNTNTDENTNVVANTNTTSNTNTRPESYSVDTDGDQLNNYLEDWLKTSKSNADSDGDSYPDGGEVTSGHSPLGAGDLRVVELESHCAASAMVKQYNLPSADAETFCGIVGDILANIQVMATNAEFFEDLDAQLRASCNSFGKLEQANCESITIFLLGNYMVSSPSST